MEISIKSNVLIITVDVSDETLAAAPLSSTGKSRVIATTSGFTVVDSERGIKVGLNVICPTKG